MEEIKENKDVTEKKFNLFEVEKEGVFTKKGIVAIQSDSGPYTKSQACAEICRSLELVAGTKRYSVSAMTMIGTDIKIGVTASQRYNGEFELEEACTKVCDLLGQI